MHKTPMRRCCRLFSAAAWLMLIAAGSARTGAAEPIGPGIWFVKVTNPPDSGVKFCISTYFTTHGIWGPLPYICATGFEPGRQPNSESMPPAEDKWLAPGATTDWIDFGPYVQPASYARAILFRVWSDKPQRRIDLIVEFAKGPQKMLVRRLEVHDDQPPLMGWGIWYGGKPHLPTVPLMVYLDRDDESAVVTFQEAAQMHLQWINEYPPHGRLPNKIRIIGQQGYYPNLPENQDCPLWQMQFEIRERLGYTSHPAVQLTEDEPGIDRLTVPQPQRDQRFRTYLQAKGMDPLDFVLPNEEPVVRALPKEQQWEHVTLRYPTSHAHSELSVAPQQKPRLFYEAQVFHYQLWGEQFRQTTRHILRDNPLSWPAPNFNHADYWPDVRQFLDFFKRRDLVMPWSEDWWWGGPIPSFQGMGFFLTALRRAAYYNDSPIMFYCISRARPDFFYRMNYLSLAHGVKFIHHYDIFHEGWGNDSGIPLAESREYYRRIYDVTHETGEVDERLYPAWPQQADAAILLSRACDVWDTDDLVVDNYSRPLSHAKHNVHTYERMALWMALRHAHTPVDVVCDSDLADGDLEPYRVLYMVGPQILREAALPIAAWVRNGGILYSSAGGGLVDEYLEPIDLMNEIFGIEGNELRLVQRHVEPRTRLASQAALDHLELSGIGGIEALTLEGLAIKQTFQPRPDAQVVGRWRDGTAGAVLHEYGKGKTLIIGATPGLAYLKPAMKENADPWTLPTQFPTPLRNLITLPSQWASVRRPVICSDPLVEATYMTGSGGRVVPLINFNPDPIDQLTVDFLDESPVKSVRSVQHGELKIDEANGVARVTLPLKLADFLVID